MSVVSAMEKKMLAHTKGGAGMGAAGGALAGATGGLYAGFLVAAPLAVGATLAAAPFLGPAAPLVGVVVGIPTAAGSLFVGAAAGGAVGGLVGGGVGAVADGVGALVDVVRPNDERAEVPAIAPEETQCFTTEDHVEAVMTQEPRTRSHETQPQTQPNQPAQQCVEMRVQIFYETSTGNCVYVHHGRIIAKHKAILVWVAASQALMCPNRIHFSACM